MKNNYLVVDMDDFGANHIISDQCQSHDCREKLQELKDINSKFKVTLFTIPYYVTPEIMTWAQQNKDWVELAYHGFTHESNYECEKMEYHEFDTWMKRVSNPVFSKGFKAPGWQISNDIYQWLKDNNFWVADQGYNDNRRPEGLEAYVNYDGVFKVGKNEIPASHHHTWDTCGNGIYETFPELSQKVADTKEFKFISEVLV